MIAFLIYTLGFIGIGLCFASIGRLIYTKDIKDIYWLALDFIYQEYMKIIGLGFCIAITLHFILTYGNPS